MNNLGASLDERIADLERQNGDLRAAVRNGFLLVNRPAEAFLAAEPWSRQVCVILGVEGVPGFAHVVRPPRPAARLQDGEQ